jgi:hypothetical protein
MSVVKDRRSSLRVEVEGVAQIHTDRGEFEGRCIDLGLGGIAIRSTRAPRPGEQVLVEAHVDGQRLRAEATLVRRHRVAGEYLLGLAFVDVDFDTQRRLEHLVFERLATASQAGFMRAFVAHADRVPPPGRHDASDRTVVSGILEVPVISGHTQVIALGRLTPADRTVIAPADRTVIAPAPQRPDAVRADDPPAHAGEPGVPDDAWLDDEMDTAQFRLLEAAQAKDATQLELEDEDLALLEPSEPASEPASDHTVVVGGFATPPPRELTLVTGEAFEQWPRERTLVTGETAEPWPRERTLVTDEGPERRARERTLVIGETTEPLPRERTLVTGDTSERPLRERTLVTGETTTRTLGERTVVESGAPERPFADHTIPLLTEPLPELPAERTIPFLRELFDRMPPAPPREPGERTATIAPPPVVDASRPTVQALLDANALLGRSGRRGKRGPRVIVSIPHRTYRRVASTPWERK